MDEMAPKCHEMTLTAARKAVDALISEPPVEINDSASLLAALVSHLTDVFRPAQNEVGRKGGRGWS
jgi:hypothetical protein